MERDNVVKREAHEYLQSLLTFSTKTRNKKGGFLDPPFHLYLHPKRFGINRPFIGPMGYKSIDLIQAKTV
ncbi:MAG: hypothetical protein DPW09_11045 [Anaerolineae bacterium]|nr:hypothetical protein [Anaerolineae bacterium]